MRSPAKLFAILILIVGVARPIPAPAREGCPEIFARLARETARPGRSRVGARIVLNPYDLRFMHLSARDFGEVGVRYAEDLLHQEFPAERREGVVRALTMAAGRPGADTEGMIANTLMAAGIHEPELAEKLTGAIGASWKRIREINDPIGPGALEIAALKKSAGEALDLVLAEHQIPHYRAELPEGNSVPVVLVTKDTYPALQAIFERQLTYGQGAKLFPNNSNSDHGVVRVLGHNMDWYFPGQLSFGETHASGLAWREIQSMLDNSSGRNPIVEVAYALSPLERQTVELYHRVRRGNFFQVRNKWVPDEPVYYFRTALLDRGFENCYMFGAGICTIEHARNMTDFLGRMGVTDVEKLLEEPRAQEFLARAEAQIMALPLNAPEYINDARAQESILHDWILAQNPEYRALLDGLIPAEVRAEEDYVRFFNYLLGVHISRRYAGVMKDLEQFDLAAAISNLDRRHVEDRMIWPYAEASKPRASAVFIYDARPEAAQNFGSMPYHGGWLQVPAGGLPEKKPGG